MRLISPFSPSLIRFSRRVKVSAVFVSTPWVLASSLCLASGAQVPVAPQTLEDMQQRLQALESKQQTDHGVPAQLYGWLELELSQSHLDELRKTGGERHAVGDLTLATAALGADLTLSPELTAHIHIQYEQGDAPLDVDEAYLTQESAHWNASLTAGQMYVPLGQFHQHQVNDTLIQALAETRTTALLVNGFNQGPMQLSGYVFKGHDDRSLETFGARMQWQNELVTVSVDYTSDLLQSGGLQEWLEETGYLEEPLSSVPAVNSFALWCLPIASMNWALSWEHLTAFVPKQNALLTNDSTLTASHSQLALTWSEQTFSIAHQRTRNMASLGLPDERLSLGIATELHNNIEVTAEWWLDHFSENDAGPTRVQSLALQLSRGF